MRKILLTGLLFVIIGFISPFVSAEASSEHIEKTVIVKYSSETGREAIRQQASTVIEAYENLPLLTVKIPEKQLQQLVREGHIEFFESNETFMLQSQFKVANVSSAELDRWNLKAMDVQRGWNAGYTGKNVKIAVIDSGIADHTDLKIAGGISFVGDSYADDHGHGTHVAGIIAGKHNGVGVAGIAPDAEMYAVKAIKSNGFGNVSTVLQAIDWSIANDMDIINLSFGDLEYAEALHEGIKKAAEHGLLIVAASGNEGNSNGTGNTMHYPARHKEVIAVASVNRQLQRSAFSGTGDTVDFAAPGEEIYSTYLNGQYATYKGTSMATPHITGLLALLKEQYPYATAAQLREGLGFISEDLGVAGYDALYGYGMPKFELPDSQIVNDVLTGKLSSDTFSKKMTTMPHPIERLALANEQNKRQHFIGEELAELLVEFVKAPTEQRYQEVMAQLGKMESAELKAEVDAAIAKVMEPAANAVTTFSEKKTIIHYKKAEAELKKLPAMKEKQQLEALLNKALQQFAQRAIQNVAQFEKQPTKESYDYAYYSIQNLPDSALKTELFEVLNKQVQAQVKQAAAAVGAYEKAQTLKNYSSALKAVQTVFDQKQRTPLEKRIQQVVNGQTVKAKTRAATYEKSKTKANRDAALTIVRELPDGKEKNQLLNRLK